MEPAKIFRPQFREDGSLEWRTIRDRATRKQIRIAILPATCHAGEHQLTEVGYNATEINGQMYVWCHACPSDTTPWRLGTYFERFDRAEFDDRPYKYLRKLIDTEGPESWRLRFNPPGIRIRSRQR